MAIISFMAQITIAQVTTQSSMTNRQRRPLYFRATMPAVTSAKESRYEIRLDHYLFQSDSIQRSPQKRATPADYVDAKMGCAHSRWMIAPA